jgi:hypothetical protein
MSLYSKTDKLFGIGVVVTIIILVSINFIGADFIFVKTIIAIIGFLAFAILLALTILNFLNNFRENHPQDRVRYFTYWFRIRAALFNKYTGRLGVLILGAIFIWFGRETFYTNVLGHEFFGAFIFVTGVQIFLWGLGIRLEILSNNIPRYSDRKEIILVRSIENN